MVKVRLWGEGAEIEELIERICNDFTGVRVLSVSGHYKDRGASVYERCYLDIVINPKPQIHKETAEEIIKNVDDRLKALLKLGCGIDEINRKDIKHSLCLEYGVEVAE